MALRVCRMRELIHIQCINESRAAGLKLTMDQYSYEAGSTMRAALLPTWAHAMPSWVKGPDTRMHPSPCSTLGLLGWG